MNVPIIGLIISNNMIELEKIRSKRLRALNNRINNEQKLINGIIPVIKCQECNKEINLSVEETKETCLHQVTDPTKCLCPECTDKWVMKKYKDSCRYV